MRDGIAAMMGIGSERIRVNMVDVGGGFGPPLRTVSRICSLAFCRQTNGLRVPRIFSPTVTDAGSASLELALDELGRFLALRTMWLCDFSRPTH